MSTSAIIFAVLGVSLLGALLIWRQPVLAFAQRTTVYLQEVRAEVRKVTWPEWEDLRKSTMVIIVFVIAIGIVIGIMDWIFSKLLIDLLGQLFR